MPTNTPKDYQQLVEEHEKDPPFCLFEKVLLAARRAKALHHENRVPLLETPYTKPALIALAEIKEGLTTLKPVETEQPALESLEELLESADEDEVE